MPTGPIIDTHLHLWDPTAIRYPWLDDKRLLNRPYLLQDYIDATAGVPVESMVFVQCEADPSAFEAEADWVAQIACDEPRIRGLVAWAPLEKGSAVREDLQRLRRHAILRGIRRIIQFEADLDFCLREDFVAGVRTLAEFDLSFDICIDHRHMANVTTFVERLPEVRMVLDHIGKPDIKGGRKQPWADHMDDLSRFPNVLCKISGVATEANHHAWRADELKEYVDIAVTAFGFDRVMFGGDWPVSSQAISYEHWVEILDDAMKGVCDSDKRKFWHDNAARFYRI